MRKQSDATLILYKLISGVDFPIKIQIKSNTAIDSIFINSLHFSKFIITPLVNGLSEHVQPLTINGLSDHDAQALTINEINLAKQTRHTKTTCDINKKKSKLN
jgi:predicted ATPase